MHVFPEESGTSNYRQKKKDRTMEMGQEIFRELKEKTHTCEHRASCMQASARDSIHQCSTDMRRERSSEGNDNVTIMNNRLKDRRYAKGTL